jgi:hypothetical protein
MLASYPASMVNQKQADLGIPNRFNLTPSRFINMARPTPKQAVGFGKLNRHLGAPLIGEPLALANFRLGLTADDSVHGVTPRRGEGASSSISNIAPERSRRLTEDLRKDARQMALIGESALQSNFADRHLSGSEQIPCAIDTLHQYPLVRRHPRRVLECPYEVATRHSTK